MQPTPMVPSQPFAAQRRVSPLPWPFWAALAAVFIGWFPSDTLSTTVGALRLHFHFFDLASLIARPTRLFTGVNRGDALTLPFGLLCVAVLAGTLSPRVYARPWARFAPAMPLALMLLCGAMLYGVTLGDTFTPPSDAGSIATALTKLGNALAGRASAVAARHITVGFGIWLALPAAVYLAHGALVGRWSDSYAERLPAPTTTNNKPIAMPAPPTHGGMS